MGTELFLSFRLTLPAELTCLYDSLLTQLGITMEHRPPYGKWLRYYWDFCPKRSARNKFALLPFEGNRTFGSHHSSSSSSSFSSSAFSIECQLTVAFQLGKAENDDEDESKMPSYLCPSPKYDLEPRQCRVFHSLTRSCGLSVSLTSNIIRRHHAVSIDYEWVLTDPDGRQRLRVPSNGSKNSPAGATGSIPSSPSGSGDDRIAGSPADRSREVPAERGETPTVYPSIATHCSVPTSQETGRSPKRCAGASCPGRRLFSRR